jgi:DNA-binding Lrp family transcriptional regulator
MDKIDKEIFEHLLHNSRLTSAEIAKQIKAPRHVVAYRKDQLFKKKIITGTDVLINFGAFGYQEFIVYLKLFRYSEIKDKIKDFMENHPNARWAGEVFPNYNLRLVFLAKTLEEFELVMAELEAVCKERIVAQEVLFGRDLLKKRDYSTKLHSKEIN